MRGTHVLEENRLMAKFRFRFTYVLADLFNPIARINVS